MKKIILNSMLVVLATGTTKAQISEAFIHKNNESNCSANTTRLSNAKINNDPTVALLVTHNSNPVGSKSKISDLKIGVYYSGGWKVFNQDKTKMDTSLAFNILIPDTDVKSWVHTADSASNTSNLTVLDHPYINGDSSAKLFISDVWNYGGKPGVYNLNPMGVFYSKATQRWYILNEDKTSKMVRNSNYSVIVPLKFSKTPNFVHVSDAGNTLSNTTIIDNVASNNNPNAKIFVTHNYNPNGASGKYHNHNIGVFYNGSKWAIFNEDETAMPLGISFNVIIYTDKVSAIKKQDMNSKIHIFPNPVENGNALDVEINNNIKGEINIEVYDLMGKLWLTKSIVKESIIKRESLLINGVAKGVYILKVGNEEFSFNQKFVIE